MSNTEKKTALQTEEKAEVKDLQSEVQELDAADAEQVRGGLSLNFTKIETKY